jgi:hypothetical protein
MNKINDWRKKNNGYGQKASYTVIPAFIDKKECKSQQNQIQIAKQYSQLEVRLPIEQVGRDNAQPGKCDPVIVLLPDQHRENIGNIIFKIVDRFNQLHVVHKRNID